MPRQYIYRFLKTSWGIYVDLTAQWLPLAEFDGPFFEVIPNVYLSEEIPNLAPGEEKYFILAIQLARRELEERLKEQVPIVIHILDLVIVLTDYAPEGLTYALVGWMAQEFGIWVDLPPPTFDKKAKRYMFPGVFSFDA